jgi:16S rRNA processing protein RimM
MDLVPVARVVKPRGFKGEVWVERYREGFPEFRTASSVWAAGTGDPQRMTVADFFEYSKGAVLKLAEIGNHEDALALSGAELLLPASEVPPEGEDEFDTEAVVGFEVRDARRGILGTVTAVDPGPAYWTFVVRCDAGEAQVPAVKGLGVRLDKAAGVLSVDLPDGYPGVDD